MPRCCCAEDVDTALMIGCQVDWMAVGIIYFIHTWVTQSWGGAARASSPAVSLLETLYLKRIYLPLAVLLLVFNPLCAVAVAAGGSACSCSNSSSCRTTS